MLLFTAVSLSVVTIATGLVGEAIGGDTILLIGGNCLAGTAIIDVVLKLCRLIPCAEANVELKSLSDIFAPKT